MNNDGTQNKNDVFAVMVKAKDDTEGNDIGMIFCHRFRLPKLYAELLGVGGEIISSKNLTESFGWCNFAEIGLYHGNSGTVSEADEGNSDNVAEVGNNEGGKNEQS